MRENKKIRVVIAGGGTAGWMAAAAMSRLLPGQASVTLVESDQIATVGVGEATIPPLLNFHRLLKIDEAEFLSAVQGTFKLGISFEGWRKPGSSYFHSFGSAGRDCWAATFHNFYLKGRAQGFEADYGKYCVEVEAALNNKFSHLPKQGLNYAYHLDAGRYAKYLRSLAEKHGCIRIEGKIDTVEQSADTGDIKALLLESGSRIEGDLFLDCTGFRSLLLGQTLGVGYESWQHWLPCDAAVALQTNESDAAAPYTRSIAHESGWRWRIPLQNRMGNGLVYSSSHMSGEEAESKLRDDIKSDGGGEPLTEANHIKFTTGRRDVFWEKNCIALGLSSGFIEPLESTAIHLIQRGIIRLLQLFPSAGIQQADVDEYNRQAVSEMNYIRDFIILHYKVTERNDSPFWRECQAMDVPETLARKIALFKHSGRIFREDVDLFAENSWTQVMLGQGLEPEQYHPIADVMRAEEQAQFFDGILREVRETVEKLPLHADYVARYCPSEK